MIRPGKVLEYTRVQTDAGISISDAKCELTEGNTVTARHYQAPGDDAFPLVGDFAVLVEAGGEYIALAFFDPEFQPLAEKGERLLTSRSGLGALKAKVHLKSDGTITLNDKVTISPEGDITTDGKIQAKGNIQSDADIKAQQNVSAGMEVTALSVGPGVKLSTHMHGSGTGPTSPPTLGT